MEIDPDASFILICSACRMLAFDPKICLNCGAKIPPSTRIKVMTGMKYYEITGYDLENFSTNTFAYFKEFSTSKAGPSTKPDTNPVAKCTHKNCACVKFLKTAEEVRENYLKAKENKVNKVVHEDETHNEDQASQISPRYFLHPAAKNVTVYDEDMACLAEGEELNDNIIDLYLNYTFYEIIPEEFRGQTHIFNSFFYKFLMTAFEQKRTKKNRLDVEKDVEKWVKNVDIFSKDFIFVPINRKKHWYLAAICFLTQINKHPNEESTSGCKRRRTRSKESLEKSFSEDNSLDKDHPYVKKGRPCICFFDSFDSGTTLGVDKISDAESLKQFLKMLWESKNPAEPYDWKNFPCFKVSCPQQDNSVDCGLYLLQYVESFFENPIPTFGNPMPELKNWFPKSIMYQKRRQVREVVAELKVNRPKYADSCGSDVVVISPKEDN